VQAVALNPEIITRLWSERITRESGESRHIGRCGRQQFRRREGQQTEHHRDPRPGHVHRGATHELGRASCLLGDEIAGKLGVPADQDPWRRAGCTCPATSHPKRWNTNEGGSKVLGRERKRTDPRWTEAVLAERSTDGRGEKTAVE